MASKCKCGANVIGWDDDDNFYDHNIKFCIGCCLVVDECICPNYSRLVTN